MFGLVAEANREEVHGAPEAVLAMLEILGLSSLAKEKVHEGAAELKSQVVVQAHGEVLRPEDVLLAEREEARAARDFERADALRDRLAEMGWTVRDSADGPKLVPR